MKTSLIIIFLILIAAGNTFSQINKPAVTLTTQMLNAPAPNPQITGIVSRIKEARETGNTEAKLFWEAKLRELTNPQIFSSSITDLIATKEMKEVSISSEALNLTRISGGTITANSISRERVNGVVFAATSTFGSTTDTVKIYRSTNNGLSFTLLYSLAAGSLKVTPNGLDVEAVSKSDTAFAFVCMTYENSGNKSTAIIRIRQDGERFDIQGTYGDAFRRFINGRITSDNAMYTTDAYVYLCNTLDSNLGSGRTMKLKFYRIENPFALTMQITSGYQNPVGAYGLFLSGSAPDSAKFESDVAFVNTTTNADQLYTVTIVRGVSGVDGSTLFFTRSGDYGASDPVVFSSEDPSFLKENPRIASTGYQNNSLMVSARRLWGGGDWDPCYFYTSAINAPTPGFVMGYIHDQPDTTIGVCVAAKYRSNGTYLFGYNNRYLSNFVGNIFIRPFSSGSLGANAQVNPAGYATTAAYIPDVSFRNVNNDSSLAIWNGVFGDGCYVSGGSGGTVTLTGNNSFELKGYSLSQNYPNPFNPNTVVSFQIPVPGFVSLKIYDVMGKEVAKLVNEFKQAGNYSIDFNAANFPSGVYYYRLEAGDFTDTKKMILVK